MWYSSDHSSWGFNWVVITVNDNIYFWFNDYAKAFGYIHHKKLENSSRDGITRPPDLDSWEIFVQIKKQQLEPDMEQQAGFKFWKEYVKAVYCHPAYLTYMQSTSWEIPGWMKHKLESRLLGEIS